MVVSSTAGAMVLHLVAVASALLPRTAAAARLGGEFMPIYHPRPSIGHVNDPNGPLFFNGVYHIFMQHSCGGQSASVNARCCHMGWPPLILGGPCTSQGVGWGHLTSIDAVHWKEQPVALAPPFVDIPLRKTQAEQGYPGYVTTGYFSGSAQVVNGQPRLLFPAVFRAPNVTAEFPSCMIGNVSGRQNIDCFFDLQLAVPKNLSDPELKEWRIVGTPFSHDIKWRGQEHYFVWEDPDQAFRDPLNPGRWLLIHDTFGDPKTGVQSPELLAIEGDDWTTPQAKASAKSLGSFCPGHGGCCPAFLHKNDIGANVLYNCDNEYVFGIFSPKAGNDSSYGLIPTQNEFPPKKFDATVIDSPTGTQGNSGASKGFYDAASERYMHWTWIWEGWQNASGTTDSVFGWESTASITRELKADLASQTLTFYPITELASLRTEQLVTATALPLPAGRLVPISGSSGDLVQGNTLDIEVEVRWEGSGPAVPHGRFILSVLRANDGSEETRVVIDTSYNAGWAPVMPHTDLPCDQEIVKTKGWCDGNCTKPLQGGASKCRTLCDSNTSCVGYSFIEAEKMCCQKRWVSKKVNNPGASAGVKAAVIQQELSSALLVERSNTSADPTLVQTGVACSNCTLYAPLRVVPIDSALSLRVLLDVSVLEAYAMHGRAHIATRAYPSKATSDHGQVAVRWEPASAIRADSFAMNSEGQRAAVADIRIWRMGPGVQWL